MHELGLKSYISVKLANNLLGYWQTQSKCLFVLGNIEHLILFIRLDTNALVLDLENQLAVELVVLDRQLDNSLIGVRDGILNQIDSNLLQP